MGDAPSGTDIDKILDEGAPGLRYFELAAVRHRRAFRGAGPCGKEFTDLCAAYDQQRGMDLGSLQHAADTLDRELHNIDAVLAQQQSALQSVAAGWSGAEAEPVHRVLDGLVRRAVGDRRLIDSAKSTLGAAVDGLRAIVRAKADTIAAMADHLDVHGKRMDNGDRDDVSVIISAAEGDFGTWNPEHTHDRVRELFADLPARRGPLSDDDRAHAQDRCRWWLDNVFKPEVETKVQGLLRQCATTDTSVHNVFVALERSLNDVVEQPYPTPHSTPPPATPHSTTPPVVGERGIGSTTSAVAPTTTSPAATSVRAVPDHAATVTRAASVGQGLPLDSIGSAFGEIAKAIGEVVGEIADDAHPLIDEQDDHPAADTEGEHEHRPVAEFDVPGGHVRISQSADGTLTVEFVDPAGTSQPYLLGIRDGLPFLSLVVDNPSVVSVSVVEPAVAAPPEHGETDPPQPARPATFTPRAPDSVGAVPEPAIDVTTRAAPPPDMQLKEAGPL